MFGKLFGLFGIKKSNKSVQTTYSRFADIGTQTIDEPCYAIDAATSTSELEFGANGNKKRRFISAKRIPQKKSKFQ